MTGYTSIEQSSNSLNLLKMEICDCSCKLSKHSFFLIFLSFTICVCVYLSLSLSHYIFSLNISTLLSTSFPFCFSYMRRATFRSSLNWRIPWNTKNLRFSLYTLVQSFFWIGPSLNYLKESQHTCLLFQYSETWLEIIHFYLLFIIYYLLIYLSMFFIYLLTLLFSFLIYERFYIY